MCISIAIWQLGEIDQVSQQQLTEQAVYTVSMRRSFVPATQAILAQHSLLDARSNPVTLYRADYTVVSHTVTGWRSLGHIRLVMSES